MDTDFFDLLQRTSLPTKASEAQKSILKRVRELPYQYRRSMELAFYNLHLHDLLAEKLEIMNARAKDRIIADFATAIQAVLRKAHGQLTCASHHKIFARLSHADSIISFNYDLVVRP